MRPSLIRATKAKRRLVFSSSERMVSSSPNSFISARSLALLIFIRSGLTFSPVATGSSPTRSASISDISISSEGPASLVALGLRPRLAPAFGGVSASAAAALGGRPGFFLASTSATAEAIFFSSEAVALAGDLDAGTGVTFVSDFLGAVLADTLVTALATVFGGVALAAGLMATLLVGFAAGWTGFLDF